MFRAPLKKKGINFGVGVRGARNQSISAFENFQEEILILSKTKQTPTPLRFIWDSVPRGFVLKTIRNKTHTTTNKATTLDFPNQTGYVVYPCLGLQIFLAGALRPCHDPVFREVIGKTYRTPGVHCWEIF